MGKTLPEDRAGICRARYGMPFARLHGPTLSSRRKVYDEIPFALPHWRDAVSAGVQQLHRRHAHAAVSQGCGANA
jgi:hypothetical protein